jgi:hypothetical protein
MSLVVTPEANESSKQVASEAMVEGAAHLCSYMTRIVGIKSEGKHQKLEKNTAMKTRHHHAHKQDSIERINLSMKCLPFLTGSQTSNALKSMYNLHADPDLGLKRVAV